MKKTLNYFFTRVW